MEPQSNLYRAPVIIGVFLLLLFGSCFAAKPIPLGEIGALPKFRDPVVSPDGRYVAVTLTDKGKPVIVVQKVLSRAEDKTPEVSVISVAPNFVGWYHWANNERLIIGVRSTRGVEGKLWNFSRMGSIKRDGTDPVFFSMDPNDRGMYRQHAYPIDWLENDPDHILAALDDEPCCWAKPRVHKINVHTGKRELVQRNNKHVYRWVADREGEVRIGVKYDMRFSRTGTQIFYRETEDDSWETLQKADYFDGDRMTPCCFDEDDPNILLVTSDNLQEGGSATLDDDMFRYDLTERRIVGPHILEEYQKAKGIVERSFPDKTVELESWTKERDLAFFRVYSDKSSPEYYLLDLQQKRLDFVAAEFPKLIDYELAEMRKISYESRDGLTIPALLTLPVGGVEKNLPLVVYPHGGPWAHDEWGFDNYVQTLANRGYAVFQPQFRGSTGFGIDHEVAGYGEWGKKIQDDITDGVKQLIETGVADPERICIVGSSFGGYAAMVGMAKTPDLYACGISVNGVMDLKKFIDDANDLLFENVNRKMWNTRKEAEETSPYHLVEQIKAPVLLIGSERDTVVPVKHSERMHKRLRKYDVPVEYVELEDGEHWRTSERNELIKLEAIEAFLAEYLSPEPASAASN